MSLFTANRNTNFAESLTESPGKQGHTAHGLWKIQIAIAGESGFFGWGNLLYTSRRRFKVHSLTLAPRVPPPHPLARIVDSEVGWGKGTIWTHRAGEGAPKKVTRGEFLGRQVSSTEEIGRWQVQR